MAVEVERDPYLAVAQPFAGDLRMNAGREHVCRVGMSKIVEADAGQGGARDLPIPIVSEGVGLQRQAILTRANKSLIGEPNAEPATTPQLAGADARVALRGQRPTMPRCASAQISVLCNEPEF